MNWAEGPYQVAGYHPHQHAADGSADAGAFGTQRTCERKFSEELEDANVVMIPRLVSLQPTRQFPYVPERMISPPGFLLPSLSSEGSFLTPHDSSATSTSGGNGMMASSMDATNHPNPYAMQPVLDMQQFDESASVDLQQLFPPASMHSLPHGGYSSMSSDPSSSSDAVFQQDAFPAMQPQPQSQPHPHPQATQHHQPQPAQPHPLSSADHSHMMVPFPFGSVAASGFDQRDEFGMQDNTNTALEMNEVSSLFNNQASLMTPPTSILTPRTSIVSPMNTFAPTRAPMLPPSLADDALGGMDARLKISPDRRKLCCVEGCKSQARAFNRCKRHGGSKRCSNPGCTKSVQSRGLCIRHGGGSRCQEEGCTRAAQSHGKCKMHGGGRPCVVPGCEKKAHLKRLCRKHGGGAKCSLEGCDKWAQRLGMCMTHSKHASPMLSSATACSSPHSAIRSPSLSDI